MRRPTLGQRATFVSAAIGIIIGVLFLFAPIHGYCMSSASQTAPPPGMTAAPATFGPQVCGVQALWQYQPVFPMPFFAVLIWSLAPSLGYLGVRMRTSSGDPGPGTLLLVLGLVVEATVLISIGAAPFFVPFVFVPQLVATAIALRGP